MAGGSGIAGGGDSEASAFLGMVSLLSDPTKLQAEYKKLEDARAAAQVIVDLAGPASEITEIRKQLADAQANIANQMTAAQDRANAIIATAEDQAKKLGTAAEVNAQELRTSAQKVFDQAAAQLSVATACQQAADAAHDDLDVRQAALDQMQSELVSQESNLAAREAALAAKVQSLVDARAIIAKAVADITE